MEAEGAGFHERVRAGYLKIARAIRAISCSTACSCRPTSLPWRSRGCDERAVSGDLTFDVIGAQGPRRFFQALTRDTIAHAYLFTGPGGTGKKTFARRLAQALLCRAPGAGTAGYDGTCDSCGYFRPARTPAIPTSSNTPA